MIVHQLTTFCWFGWPNHLLLTVPFACWLAEQGWPKHEVFYLMSIAQHLDIRSHRVAPTLCFVICIGGFWDLSSVSPTITRKLERELTLDRLIKVLLLMLYWRQFVNVLSGFHTIFCVLRVRHVIVEPVIWFEDFHATAEVTCGVLNLSWLRYVGLLFAEW